ncbi:peptidase S8 [Actinomadura sp. KC216]|uniref:S8 family serine peptidase n=1 Tax=Actinomadura sp. KC216 TaxID=2530370 RepID=UPI001048183F|nr:S8 family serine peptidase [Actinomadura sp. KC216]TDB83724.1 peptidase S8 [Actinomadura sp. KC216]
MLRRSRKVASSALAMLVFGAVAWPGAAAAAPNPLPQEWWFKSWGVQSHLWPITKGNGVTVAVIDTGVQANLPELQGVVLPGMNAEGGAGDGREDLDRFSSSPGHGTAMTSLIAAQGRGTGMLGVAPEVKILPVVAQSNPAYTKGIRFAADKGAQVINLSQAVAGPCPRDLQESIAYALGKDVVIVAGAGNDGDGANSSSSPANCKGVLSVGAVDLKFNPWEKTQRQPYVTVAAPGEDIPVIFKDGRIHTGSGTSAATALTSGAIALIRAKHPDMKNREVVRQLIASARDIHEKGRDNETGFGIIRPYRPLAGQAPKGTANPVFDEFDSWMKANHPEGIKSTTPRAGDHEAGLAPIPIVLGAILIVGAIGGVIWYVISRRKRSGPPPPPMGYGPGAPPGFGQQQPPGPPHAGQPMAGQSMGGQPGQPMGERPQFQPPQQPGGAPHAPPQQWPQEGNRPSPPPR